MPSLSALTSWFRERALAADGLLAAGCYLAQMMLWRFGPEDFWPRSWLAAFGFGLLGVLPIVIRRQSPWASIIAMSLLCALPILDVELWTTQGLSLLVVAYTAAAYLPSRPAVLATVLIWGPAITTGFTSARDVPYQGDPWYVAGSNTLIALVCFFVGRTVRGRRAYTLALEERAKAAESNQRALAAQAVADERQRIARELHDVVAHHVSVMGVLATGARRTGSRDPKAVDAALATIQESGRSAMRELRRVLDVLRTVGEPAELTPQPGLAGVVALIEQIRDAGLPVTAEIDNGPPDLDPGMALAVYRIVQEALTNTIKHAGRARATVRLSYRSDHLVLEVTDDGRGPTPGPVGVGHGLVGMRERVALYRGVLHTGPRVGGGFRVYAKIPVESTDDARATLAAQEADR
ncbi:MAG: sensor histidine kinase [Micromonosporaceae bacterium]